MIEFDDDSTRFLFLPCDIFMTISYENAQEGEKKSLVLVRGGNKMHITYLPSQIIFIPALPK